MDAHLNTLITFIIHYGYLVILPIAIAEGPIITVIAAFLAAQGYFSLPVIYVVVVAGDLIGDTIYYGLGRFGHVIAKSKLGKKLGIKDHHLQKLTGHFEIHSGKTLLFGKWAHSLGAFVLAGAGVAKMRFEKFIWYNLLGTLPKSLFFTLLGYYVGYAFQKINSVIQKTAFIIGIILVVGIIIYGIHRFMKNKKLKDIVQTVMVFGVFDRIHAGHSFFLDKAATLGDKLTIVVARDQAVSIYKGRLPELSQDERIHEIKKTYPHATVILGDAEENSWKVLERHTPDIIALGYDQNELRERLESIKDTFKPIPQLIVIEDHRGTELHSRLLREK